MAWEENSCISLNMQLIAILSRIGVYTVYTVEEIKKLSKTITFFKIYRKNIQRLLVFHKAIG